jgi:hypothetical protein
LGIDTTTNTLLAGRRVDARVERILFALVANRALEPLRQGRYRTVAGNLRVKEVVIDDGTMRDRFAVCHNPEQAERDRFVRDQLLTQLRAAIAGSDNATVTQRAALVGELTNHPGLKRFLRTTPAGWLRVDHTAVTAEARLDGNFLLRTSDPTLSAEDVAVGYKQLLEVGRGWRDMKSTLQLRPVYHQLERRIRAHMLLFWLALLLIRLAEAATGDTWRNLRHELDRMHRVTLTTTDGVVVQRTATTADSEHPSSHSPSAQDLRTAPLLRLHPTPR